MLDAVIVGANDLSMTLGVPGQWENKTFVDALNHIVASCKKARIASGLGGIFALDIMTHWVKQGMTMMYCMSDGAALIQYPAARLKEIKVPILVICGEQDAGTPPAMARDIHDNAPGSKLVMIPQAAHISNMEQSQAFTRAMEQFLAGVK